MGTIKKEQLLQEAIRLFAQYGYKKTTLDDIANAMGMTRGNLYHYVENKEDLYCQAIETTIKKWREDIVGQAFQEPDFLKKFKTLLLLAIEYPKKDPYFCALVLETTKGFPNHRCNENFKSMNDQAIEVLKEMIYEGIYTDVFRDVDVDNIVKFLYSIYLMYLMKIYTVKENPATVEEYLVAVDLIYMGLKKTGI